MRMRRFSSAVLCSVLVAGCGTSEPRVTSLDWTIMGTVARVSVKHPDPDAAAAACHAAREAAQACYAEVDAKLSAWRDDSELKRLEALPDASVLASCDPATHPCYAAAFRFKEASGGAFDPRWNGPKTLDLGAIAKGFAVDEAAARLAKDGSSSAGAAVLLDLGGNLKVVSGAWSTGVRDPFEPGAIRRLITLTNGMACATSGEYERGKHIYDARTGKPATNGTLAVTVVHPSSAMLADGLSTTLFVLGPEAGEAFRRRHHPEATAYWTLPDGTDRVCTGR